MSFPAEDTAASPVQGRRCCTAALGHSVSLPVLGQLPWDVTPLLQSTEPQIPSRNLFQINLCTAHTSGELSGTQQNSTWSHICSNPCPGNWAALCLPGIILMDSPPSLHCQTKAGLVTWVTPSLWNVSSERHSMHQEHICLPEVPKKEAAHSHQSSQQLWTFPVLSSTMPQLPPSMGIPNSTTMQDTHQEYHVLLSSWVISYLIPFPSFSPQKRNNSWLEKALLGTIHFSFTQLL